MGFNSGFKGLISVWRLILANKGTKPIQSTLCMYSKYVAPWRCTLQSKRVEALRLIVQLAGDKTVCVRKLQGKGTVVSELCVRASNRCCAWDVEVLMKQAARGTFRSCWSVWFRKLGLSGKFGGCLPVWFRKLGLSGKFGGCWPVWFRKLGLSGKFGGCWPVWFRKFGLLGKFGGCWPVWFRKLGLLGKFGGWWPVWFRKLGLSGKFGGCWPVWFRKLGLSGKFGGRCSF